MYMRDCMALSLLLSRLCVCVCRRRVFNTFLMEAEAKNDVKNPKCTKAEQARQHKELAKEIIRSRILVSRTKTNQWSQYTSNDAAELMSNVMTNDVARLFLKRSSSTSNIPQNPLNPYAKENYYNGSPVHSTDRYAELLQQQPGVTQDPRPHKIETTSLESTPIPQQSNLMPGGIAHAYSRSDAGSKDGISDSNISRRLSNMYAESHDDISDSNLFTRRSSNSTLEVKVPALTKIWI